MSVNNKYKDSLFSMLFNNPDQLRKLYSALKEVELPPDIKIDITTLSETLYLEQINDISFTIDNRLVVLIEHQSTINRNMPLRLLMYVARVYEKIIERKKIYQRGLIKIPEPEFIVLYNGKEEYPNHEVLKLSEAFKETADIRGRKTAGMLELMVNVYNINPGYNEKFMKKCETLDWYSIFINMIRENEKSKPKEEAMKAAIKYCIENGIMSEFLEKHSTEVMNMLITEWNTEEAVEVSFEEGQEKGRKEEREKWQVVVADKDAEIALLREQLRSSMTSTQ